LPLNFIAEFPHLLPLLLPIRLFQAPNPRISLRLSATNTHRNLLKRSSCSAVAVMPFAAAWMRPKHDLRR
jgi:hypothetical protein